MDTIYPQVYIEQKYNFQLNPVISNAVKLQNMLSYEEM